jgi:D-3-phosphoglycerate dehydrogenase
MAERLPRVGFVGPALALETVREALGERIETVLIDIDPGALAAAVHDLDGLVEATTRIPVDAALLASAPRLRIVSVAGTGSAHLDLDAAAARGVEVRTLFEDRELLEELAPTAEHTWGLVLACARRTHDAARHVLDGGWQRERFPGMLLDGARLGIVGMGRLGRKVAGYGEAFGMDVVAHDPVRDARWPAHVTQVGLEELFATSRVITVHVPLDATTAGMVDRSLLSRMRPDAILVNTSRGAVIDEQALADVLDSRAIAGAALDVLGEEPPGDEHPLLALARRDPRLLITPHLGGFVPEVLLRVCAHAATKVRARLEEGLP